MNFRFSCGTAWRGALAALGLAALPLGAAAQPPGYTYAYVDAACQPAGFQVQLHAFDAGQHPEITGFHFYRQTAGDCARIRLTGTPVVRVPNANTVYTVNDPVASQAIAQTYAVVGVDAAGNEIDAYVLFSVLDSHLETIATCGDVEIGTGTIGDMTWALSFEPCAGSCAGWSVIEHYPPALQALVNTGTPVRLFGTLACGSIEGCLAQVSSFEAGSCTVGLSARTWGTVKHLYR